MTEVPVQPQVPQPAIPQIEALSQNKLGLITKLRKINSYFLIILGLYGISTVVLAPVYYIIGLSFVLGVASIVPFVIILLVGFFEKRNITSTVNLSTSRQIIHFTLLFYVLLSTILLMPYFDPNIGPDFYSRGANTSLDLILSLAIYPFTSIPNVLKAVFIIPVFAHLIFVAFHYDFGSVVKPKRMGLVLRILALILFLFSFIWIGLYTKIESEKAEKAESLIRIDFEKENTILNKYNNHLGGQEVLTEFDIERDQGILSSKLYLISEINPPFTSHKAKIKTFSTAEQAKASFSGRLEQFDRENDNQYGYERRVADYGDEAWIFDINKVESCAKTNPKHVCEQDDNLLELHVLKSNVYIDMFFVLKGENAEANAEELFKFIVDGVHPN